MVAQCDSAKNTHFFLLYLLKMTKLAHNFKFQLHKIIELVNKYFSGSGDIVLTSSVFKQRCLP